MSNSNSKNTLQATIIATDDNDNSISRNIITTLFGITGQFTINPILQIGDTEIDTLNSMVFNLYVKNNSKLGGPSIIVKYKVNGGSQQQSPPLQPDSLFLYWSSSNTNPSSNLTEIALNTTSSGAIVEYFVGA